MIIKKMINIILLRQCASFKCDNNKKNLYVHAGREIATNTGANATKFFPDQILKISRQIGN